MNSQTFSNPIVRYARVVAAACAGVFLISAAPAQPAVSNVDSRFLLVFDTSSAMKDRVPATQYAVERLFFSMMNGQLQSGNTMGVWAFDRKLHAGEFPLQHWLPQNAATIASNITNFVKLRRYSSSTHFDAIMPDVNELVRSSERLTVLIFCDGKREIKGTPFDDAINAAFKKNERALQKADQVFILALRSQLGQYIGYTVNSSVVGVNFPEFPPLPTPSQPVAPVKTNLPPPPPASLPPVIQVPPLVIIGTNVGTNLIPAPPPTTGLSNPPTAKVVSNPPPSTAALTNSTNAVPPAVAKTQTNAPATPEENPSGLSRNGALAIGAVLLVAAVVLIVVVLFRSRRRNRGSLITRSMK